MKWICDHIYPVKKACPFIKANMQYVARIWASEPSVIWPLPTRVSQHLTGVPTWSRVRFPSGSQDVFLVVLNNFYVFITSNMSELHIYYLFSLSTQSALNNDEIRSQAKSMSSGGRFLSVMVMVIRVLLSVQWLYSWYSYHSSQMKRPLGYFAPLHTEYNRNVVIVVGCSSLLGIGR